MSENKSGRADLPYGNPKPEKEAELIGLALPQVYIVRIEGTPIGFVFRLASGVWLHSGSYDYEPRRVFRDKAQAIDHLWDHVRIGPSMLKAIAAAAGKAEQ